MLAAVAAISLAPEAILAGDAGGVMTDRVRIELRGTIAPQCAFQDITSTLDLGTISETGAAGEKRLDFRISCNTPFAYSLSSAQGAMLRDAGTDAAGGLATGFPYRAALSILADNGSTLTLTCGSDQLRAGPAGCQDQSGTSTAIDREASVTVSWGPIAGRLASGRYSGDLHVSLGIAN